MSQPPSARVCSIMGDFDGMDMAQIGAHFIAACYELSVRLNVSPRTVCDSAFQSLASDAKWQELRPALLQDLGRDT